MSISLPASLRERLVVHEDAPLGPLTTLGVGGRAPFVLEPRRREDFMLAIGELHGAGIPFRVLGHGSNVLVDDEGIAEVVLHTRLLRHIYHHGEQEHALRCEAGATLARLVSMAHDSGLAGAEPLIGIPGTLGGAVVGNAGGRHGSIAEVLTSVTVVDPDGSAREVAVTRDAFGYRRSPFGGAYVLDAVVQLRPEGRAAIMERMTTYLREKSERQPLAAWSAGCMFKNPPEDASGRLIEAAGCKGWREGGVAVSEQHANFMVNRGDATGGDVRRLLRRVQEAVCAESGVRLELEIDCWGPAEGTRGAAPEA